MTKPLPVSGAPCTPSNSVIFVHMCTGGENGIANEAIVLHFISMFPEERILYRFMHWNFENGCFTLCAMVV